MSISMLNALGLPVQPGLSAIDTLVGVINDARVLLVLDHCEHLLDACAAIIDSLLRSCPRLTILTTSTEAIGLAGELTWRVPPLSLTNDAIELFVDRARRVRSDFAINADTAVTVGKSADAWTVCHWRSSWPRRERTPCRRWRSLLV